MYVLLHGHLLGVECDQGSPLFCRMEGPWGGGEQGEGNRDGGERRNLDTSAGGGSESRL